MLDPGVAPHIQRRAAPAVRLPLYRDIYGRNDEAVSVRVQRRLLGVAVTLAIVLAATLFGPAGARVGISVVELLPEVKGLPHALEVQEQNTDRLLDIDGVLGTGVSADACGDAVIKVYTESALVAGVPTSVDGVPVDVEVTGLMRRDVQQGILRCRRYRISLTEKLFVQPGDFTGLSELMETTHKRGRQWLKPRLSMFRPLSTRSRQCCSVSRSSTVRFRSSCARTPESNAVLYSNQR